MERYIEAINSFDQALKFNPNSSTVRHNRGVTWSNCGIFEKAIASFERAFQLQPSAYWTWYYRGIALRQLQRYEEALNSFARSREFGCATKTY